jgi:hypothetical protein
MGRRGQVLGARGHAGYELGAGREETWSCCSTRGCYGATAATVGLLVMATAVVGAHVRGAVLMCRMVAAGLRPRDAGTAAPG